MTESVRVSAQGKYLKEGFSTQLEKIYHMQRKRERKSGDEVLKSLINGAGLKVVE